MKIIQISAVKRDVGLPIIYGLGDDGVLYVFKRTRSVKNKHGINMEIDFSDWVEVLTVSEDNEY